MPVHVPLYDPTSSRFQLDARRRARAQTSAEDAGGNSWLTTDEWRVALDRLQLRPGSRALDVACGSGGPDLSLARATGAEVVGVDSDRHAIETANEVGRREGLDTLAAFQEADAAQPLPFDDHSFDAVICVDAINHLPDRLGVLRDWHRLLRPGGYLLFTDPAVVTGSLSSEELALRASTGSFLISLLDEDIRLVRRAGFDHVRLEDTTSSVVRVAQRRLEARANHRAELIEAEGAEAFADTQRFLSIVHTLAEERRLSRFTFLARALSTSLTS